MFELRYDARCSTDRHEYYDIYKDGKPCYRSKDSEYILSFEVYRHKQTIRFINVRDEIINEILFDRHELYRLILSLREELDIEGYTVTGNDLLTKELKHVIEERNRL